MSEVADSDERPVSGDAEEEAAEEECGGEQGEGRGRAGQRQAEEESEGLLC